MGVTRADVARAAGVSPAVVSYVLSPGTRPVAAGTRERVLAAIEELGYRPNAIAQALRRGPTSSIGLLVPDHTNPFFAELAEAVEDAALAGGYVLLMGSTAGDAERESRYVRAFVDRRVDALLVVAAQSHPELAAAQASGIPVVGVDRASADWGVSTVRTDGAEGVRTAVAHLVGRGHTAIGAVMGPTALSVSGDRLSGWRRGLADAGLPASDDLVEPAPFTRDGGAAAAAALLARRGDVTALVVASDAQAVGVLTECHRRGIAVPRRLAVVAFDGTNVSAHTRPALTVVAQPIADIAATAMRRLLERIPRRSGEPTHDVLPTRLVVRETT